MDDWAEVEYLWTVKPDIDELIYGNSWDGPSDR